MTGAVTRILELDTLPKQNTEIVSSGEYVPTMEIEKSENMLGTAPQTQEVTRVTWFGTEPPISTQGVPVEDDVTCHENDMTEEGLQERLGTAPLTHFVTGRVTERPEYEAEHNGMLGDGVNKSMTSMDMSVAMGGRNKRFVIGKTFVTGLAKGITNDNKCVRFEDNVDNPKARKAPLKIQTPGLNVARMALGLATKLSIGTSENKVIMNGVKCMKGLTGSPKAKTVKAKKKISKIAIPEWLKQWQKIAADSPPREKETNNHPNTPKSKKTEP